MQGLWESQRLLLSLGGVQSGRIPQGKHCLLPQCAPRQEGAPSLLNFSRGSREDPPGEPGGTCPVAPCHGVALSELHGEGLEAWEGKGLAVTCPKGEEVFGPRQPEVPKGLLLPFKTAKRPTPVVQEEGRDTGLEKEAGREAGEVRWTGRGQPGLVNDEHQMLRSSAKGKGDLGQAVASLPRSKTVYHVMAFFFTHSTMSVICIIKIINNY